MSRRKILTDQNNGKALELRLEQDGGTFYVIIAGMTVNIHSGCVGGMCEPTGDNEYLEIENETYSCANYATYREAKQVYDDYKVRYLN